MNIDFNPAILMWTTGVQGFDLSLYFYGPKTIKTLDIAVSFLTHPIPGIIKKHPTPLVRPDNHHV